MKKLLLALTLAMVGILYAAPAQASTEISVVALPNRIDLPEILLVLGLMGFALWKTLWIRVLLSICIIIWGVFAMAYDYKIAAPFLAVGVVLLIMGALKLAGHGLPERG